MYPKTTKTNCPKMQGIMQISHFAKAQEGSALVIAIFIIIVMSLLGAALVNMLDSSQESVAYEVLGTRAYTAAQSGAQWQLGQIFPVGNSNNVHGCGVSLPPIISNINGLQGCKILSPITCTEFEHQGVRYFTIESTGQCSLDGELTSRTVEIEARSL